MRRIKVVSESTDLVPILRAFDSDVKRDVFQRLIDNWLTANQIKKEFGDAGLDALSLFEKTKLVETRWEAVEGKTEKAYHSYYTAFHINTSCSVQEIAEILSIAAMDENRFDKTDQELASMVPPEGFSARAIAEKFNMPLIRLKALLKRSARLEFKGHVVKKIE
ncbi:MAG TPA: ArsR family transcriptional regulator [Candidatus Thermoplasmatota archaeon]|nr:ArsR family transcriptional regulator [Candidatus Thermoplasmatota archaeon]